MQYSTPQSTWLVGLFPSFIPRHYPLLPHGGRSPLPEVGLLGLLLTNTLVEDLGVLGSSVLGSLGLATLECDPVALVLETLRSNETLDARGLGVWLGTLLLWLNFTTDDELADIIFLAETKETADLGGPLGSETLWVDSVGETWNLLLTLLDDGESEDGQVHTDDATTDGLPLALTSATWAVARVAIGEKESDTGWVHDTLLHWETLLVVATGDLEDVSLPLITDTVCWHLLTHATVHEDTETALIFDLDELLRAVGGETDVQLHVGLRLAWIVKLS